MARVSDIRNSSVKTLTAACLRPKGKLEQLQRLENTALSKILQTVAAFVTGAKNCSNRASRSSGGVFFPALLPQIAKLRKSRIRQEWAAKIAIRPREVRQKCLKMSHFTPRTLFLKPLLHSPIGGTSRVHSSFWVYELNAVATTFESPRPCVGSDTKTCRLGNHSKSCCKKGLMVLAAETQKIDTLTASLGFYNHRDKGQILFGFCQSGSTRS